MLLFRTKFLTGLQLDVQSGPDERPSVRTKFFKIQEFLPMTSKPITRGPGNSRDRSANNGQRLTRPKGEQSLVETKTADVITKPELCIPEHWSRPHPIFSSSESS